MEKTCLAMVSTGNHRKKYQESKIFFLQEASLF